MMRYHEASEDRSSPARVPALRRHDEAAPSSAARGIPEAPERVQGTSGDSRPQAEGQASRFPRPCRLVDSFCLRLRRRLLASEFLPSETLADNLTDGEVEAIRIIHVLTVVVTKRLFVKVAEQVERLHADVGAVQTALEQAPEVFHGVGVDVPIDILNGVVNHGVLVVFVQSIVREKFITEDRGARFYTLTDYALKFFLGASLNVLHNHFAAALDHTKNDLLTFRSATLDLFRSLGFVHITSLLANEGFVYFDFTTKHPTVFGLQAKADTGEHEPCGLLSNSEVTLDLIARDPILAVGQQPNGGKPLIQTKRRVFKD